MARTLLVGLLCLLLALTPGCGTVFFLFLPRSVDVSTNPTGARLVVDNTPFEGPQPLTPTAVPLWTGEDHVIEASILGEDGTLLKGQTTVGRRVRTWAVFLDCVFTLGLGMVVDWLSGAMYAFEEDKVWINLGKHEAGKANVPLPPHTAAPCPICGDPRGDVSPCPSCGMD